MNSSKQNKRVVSISVLIYLISFSLPALGELAGWRLFILGPIVIFNPIGVLFTVCWLSNVFYVSSLVKFIKNKDNYIILTLLAFLLGVIYFFLIKCNLGKLFTGIKGVLGIGYWIWVLNFLFIPIYSIFKKLKMGKNLPIEDKTTSDSKEGIDCFVS